MAAELTESQKSLLDFITDAYLTSNDFNGVHYGSLPPELTPELRPLLDAISSTRISVSVWSTPTFSAYLLKLREFTLKSLIRLAALSLKPCSFPTPACSEPGTATAFGPMRFEFSTVSNTSCAEPGLEV
ncbi:hypothetical protein [Arthrobacter sp. KNU40]|uniref:hypothetical protein n=1 Tax=Arthrobacter sp. KNU40 TaxID=3447965 RepID=UPI003F5EA81D